MIYWMNIRMHIIFYWINGSSIYHITISQKKRLSNFLSARFYIDIKYKNICTTTIIYVTMLCTLGFLLQFIAFSYIDLHSDKVFSFLLLFRAKQYYDTRYTWYYFHVQTTSYIYTPLTNICTTMFTYLTRMCTLCFLMQYNFLYRFT